MNKKRELPFWQSVFWSYVLMTCGFPLALCVAIEQIKLNINKIFYKRKRGKK